jgi:hypothetical protein
MPKLQSYDAFSLFTLIQFTATPKPLPSILPPLSGLLKLLPSYPLIGRPTVGGGGKLVKSTLFLPVPITISVFSTGSPGEVVSASRATFRPFERLLVMAISALPMLSLRERSAERDFLRELCVMNAWGVVLLVGIVLLRWEMVEVQRGRAVTPGGDVEGAAV